MDNKQILDKFGTLLMKNVRDLSLDFLNSLLEGNAKAPSLNDLTKSIAEANFSSEQREIINRVFLEAVDETIHNFLWMLEENGSLGLVWQEDEVNTVNITSISDGLSGELYTEDGWIYRLSKFKEHFE